MLRAAYRLAYQVTVDDAFFSEGFHASADLLEHRHCTAKRANIAEHVLHRAYRVLYTLHSVYYARGTSVYGEAYCVSTCIKCVHKDASSAWLGQLYVRWCAGVMSSSMSSMAVASDPRGAYSTRMYCFCSTSSYQGHGYVIRS